MNKHFLWMVVGCTLPLLVIFLAPALGLGSGTSLFIFILVMFGCHLLMPMHHGSHENQDKNSKSSKPENHDHHT